MMKSMVVFSSKTGNTKKVAKAIFDVLPDPKNIFTVEESPSVDEYDFIAMGFWVDKGTADSKAREFFKTVQNKKIALFGTLGAFPDSDHARQSMENVKQLVQGNEILGEFLCQGKVDPKLIRMMETRMKDDPHHSMTPERRARLDEAAKHPDEKDIADARDFFLEIISVAGENLLKSAS